MSKTIENWIFEGSEVAKTGRTASKTLSSGKKDVLYEITPVHHTTGSWKKWVREIELFQIEKQPLEDNNE